MAADLRCVRAARRCSGGRHDRASPARTTPPGDRSARAWRSSTTMARRSRSFSRASAIMTSARTSTRCSNAVRRSAAVHAAGFRPRAGSRSLHAQCTRPRRRQPRRRCALRERWRANRAAAKCCSRISCTSTFPPQRFDGIYANASLFPVPASEFRGCWPELHLALKPRGVLLGSEPPRR